jgi:hypothetical protein
MSAFSLMGVAKLLGMLELIKVKINHTPRINAVATIFDRRTKYSHTILEEIRSLFKEQLLNTIIRMNVTLKKAASKGVSVIEYDRESNGAIDYLALSKELLEYDEKEELETAKTKGVEDAIMTITETIDHPQGEPHNNRMSEEKSTLIQSVESLAKEVTFAINAPSARDIHIVGDFNHWQVGENSRLSRIQDGRWEKRLGLSPGEYKYKFVVDGEWVVDSQNSERVLNAFGTFDSIIHL